MSISRLSVVLRRHRTRPQPFRYDPVMKDFALPDIRSQIMFRAYPGNIASYHGCPTCPLYLILSVLANDITWQRTTVITMCKIHSLQLILILVPVSRKSLLC